MSLLSILLTMILGGLGVGASIRFGGGIVDARGSIAGNVFSRNASGAYLRAKVKGTNPETPAQTAQRNAFGAVSSLFSSLTAGQAESWRTAAAGALGAYTNRLGEAGQLTAQQLYVKLNATLSELGVSPLAAAPTEWSYPNLTGDIFSYDIDASALDTDLDPTIPDGAATVGALIYVSDISKPTKQAMSSVPQRLVFRDATIAGSPDLEAALNNAVQAAQGIWGRAPLEDEVFNMRVVLVDLASGTKGPDRTFHVPVVDLS